MSTAPQGWQNPKTNWQAADVVNPSDFNRIEGNIQAIESGSRTLAPSQAPSGNSGPLRQVLDWFANRIRAITGASNWYDTPPATLTGLLSALNTHKSSGDHDGRYYTKSQLNTSGGGGQVHWNNVTSKPSIPSNPVPVTQLKKATGSTTAALANIHRYAFGSVSWGGERKIGQTVFHDRNYSNGYTKYRFVQFSSVSITDSSTSTAPQDPPSQTISWDYLTASGFPSVWAVVDDTGNIITMWEAEDPIDWEFPDECPIIDITDEDGNSLVVPPGGEIIPLHFPTEKQLVVIQGELSKLNMPTFSHSGVWAAQHSILTPQTITHTIFNNAMQERLLEPLSDIREAFAVSDVYKRNWRIQLWLRAVSRVKKDHREFSLIPLYQEMFRADKRTGYLEMK